MERRKQNFFQELDDIKLLELELDIAVWKVSEWQCIGYLPEAEKSKKEVIRKSKKLHNALKNIRAQLVYGNILLRLYCKLNGTEKYLNELSTRVTYNLLGIKSKELA
jgi:hypothetical protein